MADGLTGVTEAGVEEDPLLGFRFSITLDSGVTGYFTEVSGIGAEVEVVQFKVPDQTGNAVFRIRKLPGRTKWMNVVLKRGVTENMDFWEWLQKAYEGGAEAARQNATITMYDETLTPKAEWSIDNAWPIKVAAPTFKSEGNEYGIEEIELVHEGMRRVQV
jgi:phage tail-like protein